MKPRTLIGIGSLVLFVVLAIVVYPLFWSTFAGVRVSRAQAAWRRGRSATL